MKPLQGPPPRLREAAPGDPTLGRAAVLVRAVPAPRPLGPRAEARVRAALGGEARAAPHRWPHLLVPAAALLALAATGAGAAAAVAWMRRERPAEVVTQSPRPAAVAALPRVTAPPPRPLIAIQETPARYVRRHPVRAAFARPELAIDPYHRDFRPILSAELARLYTGQDFKWKVKICVGRDGTVTSAQLLEHQHPALDRELAAALRTWRYRPATRAGRPVPACLGIAYQLRVAPGGTEEVPNPRTELRDQTD
jgi:TonB family protein